MIAFQQSRDLQGLMGIARRMQVSEGEHLKAFCNFIIGDSLDGTLRNHQWATLAAGYNGPAWKDNAYDTKLAAAFAKYSK